MRIFSFTLKQLQDATDPYYLRHKQRTDELKQPTLLRCFANTVITRVASSKFTENGKYWHQYFMFPDLRSLCKDKQIDLRDAVELAIEEGDVHIACDCVHPDVKIITARGVIPIKEVVPGDKVYTHKGRFKTVLRVIKSNEKKQFYKVKFSGQLEPLICSGEHPILTQNRGCPTSRWVKVSDLMKSGTAKLTGDCGLLPVVDSGKPFNPQLARLLGYYLAEGSLTTYATTTGEKLSSLVRLAFNCNEESTLVKDISSICSLLGYEVSYQKVVYPKQSWLSVSIKSLEFANYCLKYCGRFSTEKKLDAEVFTWDTEARKQLLVGHFLGDGYKILNTGMSFMTTSLQLAYQLQVLIASLGLNAFLSYKNKNINPHCDGRKRVPVYQVRCSENSCGPLYEACIPFLREKDKHLVGTRGKCKSYVRDGYFYRKIQSVTPIDYSGEHYDLTVEDDESFVANSVIIHNCPAWEYWAYKYYSTAMKYNYGAFREFRAPTQNNTQMKSLICKHMDKAAQYLQSNVDQVATWFEAYYNKTLKKEPEQEASEITRPMRTLPDKPRYASRTENEKDTAIAYEDETEDVVYVPSEQTKEEVNSILEDNKELENAAQDAVDDEAQTIEEDTEIIEENQEENTLGSSDETEDEGIV